MKTAEKTLDLFSCPLAVRARYYSSNMSTKMIQKLLIKVQSGSLSHHSLLSSSVVFFKGAVH